MKATQPAQLSRLSLENNVQSSREVADEQQHTDFWTTERRTASSHLQHLAGSSALVALSPPIALIALALFLSFKAAELPHETGVWLTQAVPSLT